MDVIPSSVWAGEVLDMFKIEHKNLFCAFSIFIFLTNPQIPESVVVNPGICSSITYAKCACRQMLSFHSSLTKDTMIQ